MTRPESWLTIALRTGARVDSNFDPLDTARGIPYAGLARLRAELPVELRAARPAQSSSAQLRSG